MLCTRQGVSPLSFFSDFKKYAPIALLSFNLSSCYRLRQHSEHRPDHTEIEMAELRRDGLELERRIEGTVNANVYTTIDARALMEDKDNLIQSLSVRFKDNLEYFNSFCNHPVNEINIVIDSSPQTLDSFGFVPFFTNIMVLDESMLETTDMDFLKQIQDMTVIHEYAHIQLNAQDGDEPATYKEFSSIIVESMNLIRLYGYDWYNEKYMEYSSTAGFNPETIFSDESSYYALRLMAYQFMKDSFEGNISSDNNETPLSMLEHFARNYFKEEANRSEGFNLAAEDTGLIFNARLLELEDIRQRAYSEFLSQSHLIK